MTDAETTAKSLIEQFGFEEAISHVNFVMNPEFGLSKSWQKLFWHEVSIHIIDSAMPESCRLRGKILQK